MTSHMLSHPTDRSATGLDQVIVLGFQLLGRKMRIVPLLLLLLLAGCTGYSRECLDWVAHANCPPDSPAGEAMEQQRKETQTFTEIDEARCRSSGKPGSQEYARCRASLEKDRSGFANPK